MKRNKKVTLSLHRKTIRKLTDEDLRWVAGGTFVGGEQTASGTCDTYTCNGCYGSGSGSGTAYNY